MKIINPIQALTYLIQTTDQPETGNAAAATSTQSLEKNKTSLTLGLEWLRQLRTTQESQELRARWRVK